MTAIEREIELDRRLEALKTALREYVDFLESIKRNDDAPNERKPCKGPANNVFV